VNVKSDNNQSIIASYTNGDSNERLILEEAGVRTYCACGGSAEYTETGGATTPQWSKTYIYLGARLLSTLHSPLNILGVTVLTPATSTQFKFYRAGISDPQSIRLRLRN